MIRKINLIHHKHKSSIPGFSDVQISDLDSIINYSVDVAHCSILNKLEKNKINQYLDQIATKIRYGGQLVLVIHNIRAICSAYTDKLISDQFFFEVIKDVSESLSQEEVILHISNKHGLNLIGLEKNNYSVALSFQRNHHD